MASPTAGVAITGADGFVGRHLQGALGDRAVPLDVDVTNASELRDALRETRPTAVVHLAGRSSGAESWEDPDETWRVNAIGTVNLLEAVRRESATARVVVVSSGEVYGRAPSFPTAEDAPIEPLSPYAASKAAAEVACGLATRAYGLDVVVARPFPHVGPGQDERFAIGSWLRQTARLEVAGGGTLRVGDLGVERDLTDVRDVCRAYRALLDPSVRAGTYNISSGTAVTMGRIVEVLVGMARCPITVERDQSRVRPMEIAILLGDASRLRSATGWRPEIPLEQTVADALDEARRAVAEKPALR